MVSRNAPVALVVGAATFLGSRIVEKLLDKDVQVIGVDDFSVGKKENLEEAVKDKKFHLLNQSSQNISPEIPRLDYIFITSSEGKVDAILEIAKKHHSKVVFVSTIELYDNHADSSLDWYKDNESKIAQFAKDYKLNARVVRLAPVFGPRMHFKVKDPLIRLINATLRGEIDQENSSLDYSTRALYIDDAADLVIKSMLSGATALKIFDGALKTPIKVSEIKQVLKDPLWYEQANFEPTELPDWPTPNLEKTIKTLNWHPTHKIVKALKDTITYFKDNEIEVEEQERKYIPTQKQAIAVEEEGEKIGGIPTTRSTETPVKKHPLDPEEKSDEKGKVKKAGNRGARFEKFKPTKNKAFVFLALILIGYAIIFPVISLGVGVLSFRYNLTQAAENLQKGEYEKSLGNVKAAENGVEQVRFFLASAQVVKQAGVLQNEFDSAEKLVLLADLSADSARSTIEGVHKLYLGLQAVTGEVSEPSTKYFKEAQIDLITADENLSKTLALMNREDFKQGIPEMFKERVNLLQDKIENYTDLVRKGRAAATLLPEVIGSEGKKSYLLLLQNNNELRPTGGFIGSFAQIDFENGKLKKIDVNDIYNIDGLLTQNIEPPAEIKSDLGQSNWYLRDSNWEPDFPTSARQAEWFYVRETGNRVDGVIALDISAVENLLDVVGPLDLRDYSETVTPDNLFEKSIAHAEQGFFPGSQAKKSFLTALSNEMFNKLFFLPNQNWPGIVSAIGKSLEEKHLSIYLANPKLFSYLVSQNWTSALPRATDAKSGEVSDFLAVVEANLGANKSNYYIERKTSLETVVGKEGEVNQRLRINYINRSPSNTWPAGKYKNRMRVYLPFGAKVSRAIWGETDVTPSMSSFVDYGRTGYSVLLELEPKESKTFVLDYQLPLSLTFAENMAKYRLDVIKQAGTLSDPFEWKISYPLNYKINATDGSEVGPQEHSISTDLSKDRSFEVTFSK